MSKPELPVRIQKFQAKYSSLEPLRDLAGDTARDAGLDERAIYAVQMAVDEAFTNIIEHAYGQECDDEVECRFEVEGDALIIQMRDCGGSFNPEAIADPDLSAPLEEREVGGLGLFFMRQLMDEVRFQFLPDEGGRTGCNVLTMIKRKEKDR